MANSKIDVTGDEIIDCLLLQWCQLQVQSGLFIEYIERMNEEYNNVELLAH